jgi:uncharacterized OB-fold protein
MNPRDFAPDELDLPFWEACQRGEFLLLRCPESGRYHWPAVSDPETGSNLEWVPASGRGTIHTFAVLHKAYRREYAGRVPYNVIVVELEEGPFFHSNLIECDNAEIHVGMRVEVVFERQNDQLTLPLFRPRSESVARGVRRRNST